MAPPVPAHRVGCSGTYCLWALPRPGYIHVYDTTGVLTATRANVGSQSQTLLASPLLGEERDLTVAFNGQAASEPTAGGGATLEGSPGRVITEHADLANGTARAVVTTNRRATVVLSASYDPGWRATVNGRPTPTVMVAPALVGVVVGPGVHTVAFSYGGYGSYDALLVLALAVLVVLALAPTVWRRARHGPDGAELLQVALDGVGRALLGPVGVLPGVALGPALAQEVPHLVEGDLEVALARQLLVAQPLADVRLLEALLLRGELADPLHDLLVVHVRSDRRPNATVTGASLPGLRPRCPARSRRRRPRPPCPHRTRPV